MTKPDRTFVIPTVTNVGGLYRAIDTIYENNEENSFRIIVINNSAEPLDSGYEKKAHIVVRPYYNLGFAKSCNVGIRLTDTPYVVLWNDDAELIDPRWWDGVLETFKRFPNAACVNPSSVMDRNDKPRIEYKEKYTSHDYDNLIAMGNGTVIDAICMWGTVIPMTAIERIGMLDEKFYPGGGEDYDWNRRAYMLGYRCLGTSLSWAWHWWGATKDKVKSSALPQRAELRWNGFEEKWGKGADLYGTKGRRDMMPSDYKRIVEL